MAKTRVSELAKTYGITSKEALDKLKEIGEFAKTASSSIELPAVKKFEAAYGADLLAKKDGGAAAEPAAKPTPAKKAAAAPAPAAPAPAAPAAEAPV
ncbi:translation initiation factor IF-2 N-terminal domain-containing protein, partial [Nocardioides ultimimeridianus]